MQLSAIINITPDSFSGDGNTHIDVTLKQAQTAVQQGANILDIGAESTRPGATPLSIEEEAARLLPVLQAIRTSLPNTILSVDTYKPFIAEQACRHGINWLNDIHGGRDIKMLEIAVQHNKPIILMHNTADIKAVTTTEHSSAYTAHDNPHFIEQLLHELAVIRDRALDAGISQDHIILDPGFGFGKTVEQNLLILNHTKKLHTLGCKLFYGFSRKSFIGEALKTDINNRVEGTAACLAYAAREGVHYARVHDIQAMHRILTMTEAIERSSYPPLA